MLEVKKHTMADRKDIADVFKQVGAVSHESLVLIIDHLYKSKPTLFQTQALDFLLEMKKEADALNEMKATDKSNEKSLKKGKIGLETKTNRWQKILSKIQTGIQKAYGHSYEFVADIDLRIANVNQLGLSDVGEYHQSLILVEQRAEAVINVSRFLRGQIYAKLHSLSRTKDDFVRNCNHYFKISAQTAYRFMKVTALTHFMNSS